MVIDILSNAARYYALENKIAVALQYLQTENITDLLPGKYAIEGTNVFAIIQEYNTLNAEEEQMESHRRFIDVQYIISGAELVGHAVLQQQEVSKDYDEENDFILYADQPDFFTKFKAGMFMIFFPTDLHMPCIKTSEHSKVKKVVVKVRV